MESGGVSVRVMAGESMNTTGPIKMRNPGMLLDCRLSKGSTFKQNVSHNKNIMHSYNYLKAKGLPWHYRNCFHEKHKKPSYVVMNFFQVPSDWNGFTYVYQGTGIMSGTKAQIQQVK